MPGIDDEGLRKGAINGVRRELSNVADNLEAYIPDAAILDDSVFKVEIDLGKETIVHCDFRHLGSAPR